MERLATRTLVLWVFIVLDVGSERFLPVTALSLLHLCLDLALRVAYTVIQVIRDSEKRQPSSYEI